MISGRRLWRLNASYYTKLCSFKGSRVVLTFRVGAWLLCAKPRQYRCPLDFLKMFVSGLVCTIGRKRYHGAPLVDFGNSNTPRAGGVSVPKTTALEPSCQELSETAV